MERIIVLKGVLEVIEFEPRHASPDAVRPDYPRESEDLWSRLRREHRALTSCAAGFMALALHFLFVAPVFWAGGSSQNRQQQRYRGDTADMQWVVLADSSGHSARIKPHPTAPILAPIGVTDALPTLLLSLPPVEASDSSGAQAGDQASLGELYGRYVGQIHARIDRAWLRPRTAIGARLFQCQVQLDQDSSGRVQEITLLECNGDTRWQLSLVRAIQAASPLPAPPNPAVFVHHVLLAFRAMAYSPGASVQLYAQAPGGAPASDEQNERDAASQNAFQTLREAAQAQKSKVVKLRIEGSKIDVEPDRQ